MLSIAHRGASAYAVENTFSAFDKAVVLQADMIELDVHKIKTGEFVIFHDYNIEIETGIRKNIAKMTFNELRKVKIKNIHQVPFLTDFLKKYAKKIKVNIEIKFSTCCSELLDVLYVFVNKGLWDWDDIIISSFDWKQLISIARENPFCRVGVLTETDINAAINFAISIKSFSIHPNYKLLNPKIVRILKKHLFKIYPWTVDDKKDILKMKSYKVDGIITNFPNKIK